MSTELAPAGTARMELIDVACPLCGSNDTRMLYKPWNLNVDPRTVLSASGGVRGTQYIVQCKQCDLIYVNPRPRGEIVVDSYASAVDEIYVGAGATREATFKRCVSIVEKYAPRGKLLDVGAAAGFFVKAAKDAGWDALGVEPCRWLAEYGEKRLNVKVIPLTLAQAHFPDESFDLVTMWDVLEHVPDPYEELREVFRILRPNGLLVVNFPDVGTWQAKLAGKNWWFFLSVHLTYFTQKTLTAMLGKTGFGDFTIRPHFQVLNLGHLMKMGALYAPGLSKAIGTIVEKLRVAEIPIPYYASQTNLVARKTPSPEARAASRSL